MDAAASADSAGPPSRSPVERIARWVGGIGLALLLVLAAGVAYLHSSPGRQFVVGQIAELAPESGLRIEVGSIEGSILWSATLNDVRLRDANGALFLELPLVDLGWRPWKWLISGLDIRHLVITGGSLHAIPELRESDPDAPILPDFDIRVDNLTIIGLNVAQGIAGDKRVIEFSAKAEVSDGLVLLDAEGALGGGDVFAALVHAEPEANKFDLDLDWRAPKGGLLAALVGGGEDLAINVKGEGSWQEWQGQLLALQGSEQVADFALAARAGEYSIEGRARPGGFVDGIAARALGDEFALAGSARLEDSMLSGRFGLGGGGLDASGQGNIDLAGNAFRDFDLAAKLLDPELFGGDVSLGDARIEATLNGPFRDLSVAHVVQIGLIDAGGVLVRGVQQRGTLTFDGKRVAIPLALGVERVISGNALFDPKLANGRIGGTLSYTDGSLTSQNLTASFAGVEAQLALASDLPSGRTQLTGPITLTGLPFENVGSANAVARIDFTIGGGAPWRLASYVEGRLAQVSNGTISNLAGDNIRFAGGLILGRAQPVQFQQMQISASKLTARIDGSIEGGRTLLAGEGRQADFGAFTLEAAIGSDGPRAVFVFADPYPAAGLKDVRIALAPKADGFHIETDGGSLLGPFDGLLDLRVGVGGGTTILIERIDVAQTRVNGDLRLVSGGVAGNLAVARGGVDGIIGLAIREGGQAFDVNLTANNARLGGATPLSIARGRIEASGLIASGDTSIRGHASLQGLSYGNMFLGRLAAQADIVGGVGHFDAALAGRRGSRFELRLNGEASAERIALAAEGSYAGRDIAMPRRAVLRKAADGGWELQRTQLAFGGGHVLAEGRFGGDRAMQARLALADLPLDLAGALGGDLDLGGKASGIVELAQGPNGLPTGEARVMIEDLTRSSSLLTSQPMDIALVGSLSESLAQARAVMSDAVGARGRFQARISRLPRFGGLTERLYAGDLAAHMRYSGPAAALWRLAAIDLIDLTGEASLAADISGSLGDPRVRGSLAGDALRLRSAITGTDITGLSVRGRFAGSRLNLTSFSGSSRGGGQVSGSGFFDLANIAAGRGPQIDLRIAARNARIMDLDSMGATVSGPLRIVSDGVGGTIAGRLSVSRARWVLGRSEVLASLPDMRIREINLPADAAPAPIGRAPWRYLIDAAAPGGIKVEGMGLDSQWRGTIRLRGTTLAPRIGGEVQVVPRQGYYSFAGTRFELTRGQITFDENLPIDPQINILAQTDANGLAVSVNVQGSASQPEIAFTSTPSLPEEELLARLLFGGSITTLSATDALQLGEAVASLRGGAGIGPLNQLRSAIGLDRLRIVAADPALGRGTAVALGKNVSRRFFVEIVTDGAGYNATDLEFRVTNWLSLLGTVSSIGRHEIAAQVRRDY